MNEVTVGTVAIVGGLVLQVLIPAALLCIVFLF